MPYFDETHLADLAKGYNEVQLAFGELRDRYISRAWKSADAREFAMHGFGRRLGTLIRNIESVFSILPPELDSIPDRAQVADATTNLLSFVVNVFGCLDNLAWIWVYERGVTKSDGTALNPLRVGLQKKNEEVWASLPIDFRNYLDEREEWFEHIKGVRDSLAHRIPLYIPPFVMHPEKIGEYEDLERRMAAAMKDRDFARYDQLMAEQMALGTFKPWMSRSLVEAPQPILFHPQLIADFKVVDEIARKILAELENAAAQPD